MLEASEHLWALIRRVSTDETEHRLHLLTEAIRGEATAETADERARVCDGEEVERQVSINSS